MRVRPVMDLPRLEAGKENDPTALRVFASKLIKAVKDRDVIIARAVNANDIQIVATAPTSTPDFGEPAIQLYENGSTFRIYCYFGTSGWKYATLS